MSRKLIPSVMFASALSLFIAFPGPLRIPSGIILSYFLPGFTFLSLFGMRNRTRLDDLFLSLCLSPILLSLMVLAFHRITRLFDASISAAILFLAAVVAAVIFIRRDAPSQEAPAPDWTNVLVPIAFAGSVLALYAANGFLTIRSDAWYHASVAQEIIGNGIPPMEPRLPDVPIRYMWIYHLFIATTMRLTGLSVFKALALFNVASAFVFPYLVSRLAGFLTDRRANRILISLFAIVGVQAAAWIFWPITLGRAFVGDQRGIEVIVQLLRSVDLNSYKVIYFLSPFEDMTPIGNWMVNVMDKFITITPFSYALNTCLAMIVTILSVPLGRRVPARAVIAVFTLGIGTMLFHVIIGTAAVISAVGSGVIIALLWRLRRQGDVPLFHAAAIPLSALLAAACVWPYVSSLTTGPGTSIGRYFHLGIRNLLTIALPLAVLSVPTRRAVLKLLARGSEAGHVLLSWIACLLALNLFADLPTRNESKLLFPFFLLLSPIIAWQIIERIREATGSKRALFLACVTILFIVPAVLTSRGFLLTKPASPIESKRHTMAEADRAVFEWIRNETPRNAVIIESNTDGMMPVLALRRNFYPPAITFTILGYREPRIEEYGTVWNRLFSGEPIPSSDIERLIAIGLPIYIVLWREDLERKRDLGSVFESQSACLQLVYSSGAARIYHVVSS